LPDPDGPSTAMTVPTSCSFPSTIACHPRLSNATARRMAWPGSTLIMARPTF
jgi:hypothetical protein